MKKKILLFVSVVCAALCVSFGLNLKTTRADSPFTVENVTELKMVNGASVRLTDGVTSDGCGIRFSFFMNSSEYESLIANTGADKTYSDIKFGVFIAAADYNVSGYEIADENNLIGENAKYFWQTGKDESGNPIFNVENPNLSSMKRIICAEGDKMLVKPDGKAYFYGSAVNMKDQNLTRGYVGVGYIRYTVNGETHYKFAGYDDNVRSMEQVAREAYKKETEHRESLKALYLNKVARTGEVVVAPAAVENLIYSGEKVKLVTAGTASDYFEMAYSLDGEVWLNEIPEATEAGKYTVYYKAQAQTDFDFDSEAHTVEAVIAESSVGNLTLKAAKINEKYENSGGTNVFKGFGGSYDYKGLGEYKTGDVLEFRFKGKNIPNVALFANKNGVNALDGGTENTGIFIQTSGYNETFSKRTYITGPFLLDAGGQEAYRTLAGLENYVYKSELGKNIDLHAETSNTGNTSLFSINYLDDNKNYIYRVWTDASGVSGKVKVNLALYATDGSSVEIVKTLSVEITHYLSSLDGRYAVVYGAGSHYGKDVSFGYVLKPDYDITVTKGTLSLNSATINERKPDGSLGYNGSYDFSGLGEYKTGDTLEFSFTGKNIPNVALFANKNGVNPIGGGTENTGIFLQSSGHGTATFNKRLYFTGPFLADAGSQEAYRTLPGLENYVYNIELGKNMQLAVDTSNTENTSLFGIDMLEDGVNYGYRITTIAANEGQITIKVSLHTVSEGVETQICAVEKTITHYLSSLDGRYAVVYGAGDFYGKQITFSYNVKRA